jgi:plasmid stabilization system protein ParE
VRVRWQRRALSDLKSFKEWLETLPDANADRVVQRIKDAAQRLGRLGDIGRPSKLLNIRELSVANAPYVIAYQMRKDFILIVAVYHTSQNR